MGKKINELNAATDINYGTLLFVGDPNTGSLKKISVQDFSAHIFRDKLDPGTSSYYVYADTKITGFWIQGGSQTDFAVSNEEGGNDLVDYAHLPENGDLILDVSLKFRNSQWIYFTGVQEDTVIIIYKS